MSGSKLIVDSALRAAVNLQSSKIAPELIKSSSALFSAYAGVKQTLPGLAYDYNALERKLIVQVPVYNVRFFCGARHSTT
jgi:hypothetical protein